MNNRPLNHTGALTLISQTNEGLVYEKTGLLAALEHDQEARDLSAQDRQEIRDRVSEINRLLSVRR